MLNSTVINNNNYGRISVRFFQLNLILTLISSVFFDSIHYIFPVFNCLKTNPVWNLFGAAILLQVRRALAKPQRRYINNKQLTRAWQAESGSYSTLDLPQTIQIRRMRLCLSNARWQWMFQPPLSWWRQQWPCRDAGAALSSVRRFIALLWRDKSGARGTRWTIAIIAKFTAR